MNVNQRFEKGKILYETVTPFIAFYRSGQGFIL